MTAKLSENVIALTRDDDRRSPARQPAVAGRFDEVLLGGVTEMLIVGDEPELAAAKSLALDLPALLVPPDASLDAIGSTLSASEVRRIFLCLPPTEAGQQRAMAISEKLGTMRCRLVRLSHGLHSLAEVLETGLSGRDVEAALKRATPCDAVLREIEQIDRNDPFVASAVRDRIVPLLVSVDQVRLEDYLTHIRKLGLPHTAMKSLRREIQRLQAPPESDDHPKEAGYEMTAEEEAEALELLRDPEIVAKIRDDLGALGVVGEDANKTLLFLAYVSRLTSDPMSVVVFGKSADGKSYLVNKVADTVPPEHVLRLSSASARSLEYAADLNHRVIIVQELEGAEEVLPIIRTAQSEGKLCRMTTLWDSNTGPRTLYQESEVKSVWVVTTTQEDFHDENSTRNFSITVNSSPDQTAKVMEHSRLRKTLAWRRQEVERKQKLRRLQNMQRLLKPVEVMIPYAHHLTHPSSTSRHRRDFERFLSLIQVTAFIKQATREVQADGDLHFIEASVDDYRDVHSFALPILRGTLNELSERCLRVLKVILTLREDAGEVEDLEFTVKDIQRKAATMGVDLANLVDLRKQVRQLAAQEVLECTSGSDQRGGGVAKKFRLSAKDVDLDDNGEVTGVVAGAVGILSPEELEQRIQAEQGGRLIESNRVES